MPEPIGFQDGITAFFNWFRKQPGVPGRGPNYDPADLSTWPWPDKMERTLRILKDEHDAAVPSDPPPPPPPPPPPTGPVAPRTYNKVLPNGSDARFCVAGLSRGSDGLLHDIYSGYDDNGLDVVGGRTKDTQVAGLRQANNMDGRGPCEFYDGMSRWPDGSYAR
jgi:hypothetical protein